MLAWQLFAMSDASGIFYVLLFFGILAGFWIRKAAQNETIREGSKDLAKTGFSILKELMTKKK
jgi:hypothetical protein